MIHNVLLSNVYTINTYDCKKSDSYAKLLDLLFILQYVPPHFLVQTKTKCQVDFV